ncbi:MAG TPA: FecR domain-containing protein [Pyrinomonadaceae bacterium]|nr:FecR domain-containing protein [Pyrinomonadaceae bacterium]
MNKNEEVMLDKVTADIRNEFVDAATVSAAAERVWARLSAAADTTPLDLPAMVEHIEGCNDFQSLIPAYLSGSLSEARSLLLVDHTHECIPCRKAMKEARAQRAGTAAPARATRSALQPMILRWGIAAALVIGIGLLAVPFVQRYWPLGDLEATVQAAEGHVFQVADTRTATVSAGARLQAQERIRTAKDGRAIVRLKDGSTIEMKDRSEVYLTKSGQGTTIHLDRGSIVVEAAKQRGEHLFVETADSLVSVTGTVFSVNNGTKGSRVSVVEGQVKLNHAGSDQVLSAGEQVTTNPSIALIPVKDEVAWSRKADQYASALRSLAALKVDLNKIPSPQVRTSTHLLNLMPADSVVYAAIPNLANNLVESHRLIEERMNQNPALREWWQKEQSGKQNMDQVMQTIRQFGDYLGEEIAVSVSLGENAKPEAPLVLAELKNSTGLREFIEQEIARYSAGDTQKPNIQFVDNPLAAAPVADGAKTETLYVWIQNDLLAASPRLDRLQQLAQTIASGGTGGFATNPFHDRIAQVYLAGAGLVVAANLEQIIAKSKAERATRGVENEAALEKLGILSVKYFILDQKETGGKTHTQAALSFNDTQKGIPSWLAAPGPMGSLEYISADANVVGGFVVKNPVALVDDLLDVLATVSPDLRKNIDAQQTARGLNIRDDIAAPLGGEFAFAIDGPVLPTPAWKMVFEVNDPQHLQQTLELLVGEVNKEAAKFGKSGLVMDREELDGRTFYTLKSTEFTLQVNYAYANGYLIVAPTKALVQRALTVHDAGNSLLHSPKFTAGLPADGNANFSAVLYHNLAPIVQPFANQLANTAQQLPQGPQAAVKAMAAEMAPTLAYAYAQGDSITFAANTDGGPFGLSPATIFGMPNALEMQSIIGRSMHNQK